MAVILENVSISFSVFSYECLGGLSASHVCEMENWQYPSQLFLLGNRMRLENKTVPCAHKKLFPMFLLHMLVTDMQQYFYTRHCKAG